MPGRSKRLVKVVAEMTDDRSGPLSSASGVGTQMTTVPGAPIIASSAVALKPSLSIALISSSAMSGIWDRPELSPSTMAPLVSKPVTVSPARLASTASGSPTYPRPMTRTSGLLEGPCGPLEALWLEGSARVMASSTFKEPPVVPARFRQNVYLGPRGYRYRRGDFSYDLRQHAGRHDCRK